MSAKPRISLIVAMARNGIIGTQNSLPWHLPSDLKRFRLITMGKPILMGRKTHESIGRVLPGRKNIVLTENRGFAAEGCTVAHTVEDAVAAAEAEELMVIGGEALYRAFLPCADRMYLTLIHQDYEGDTFFPDYRADEWQIVEQQDIDPRPDTGEPGYSFMVLERKH